MPIDPGIPLGVRPAQFNLGEMFGAMQGMQQMRAQGQQSRMNALKLQEAEQEQADHDAINAVLKRAPVGQDGQPDYAAAASVLEQAGRGAAAQKLRKFNDERTTAQIDQAKKALDLETARYDDIDRRGGLAYNELSSADATTYGLKRANAIALMPQAKAFLPEKYDKEKIAPVLKFWENTKPAIETRKQLLAEIKDKAFLQKTEQESHAFWSKTIGTWLGTTGNDVQDRAATLARAKQAGASDAVIAQFGDPQDPNFLKRAAVFAMGPDKVIDNERQNAAQAETGRHNRVSEGLSAATNAREQSKFQATYGAGVAEDGKPLPVSPTAKAIAEYRIPPPAARSMASGAGQALMAQVMAVNPDYHGEEFALRSGTRKAFTTGPQGQTLNSLNTAIEHLDQFVDAAKELNNGNFKPGNAAYNYLRETFGSTAPTNFSGIKTIMAGELASAFKKSGATDTEIKNVEESIGKTNSAQQLIEYATRVAIPALGSKAAVSRSQYRQTMGDKDPWDPLTPGARAVLAKHGYDPEHPTMGGAKAPAAGGGKEETVEQGGHKYRVKRDAAGNILSATPM